MTLIIDGKEYVVKKNMLHRGGPFCRLVLEHIENKKNVSIQFDNSYKVINAIKYNEFKDQSYLGYWITGVGHRDIKVQIKEL